MARVQRRSWIRVFLGILVVLAPMALAAYLGYGFFVASPQPWHGDLVKEMTSSDREWKVGVYDLNPGAMSHERMRIEAQYLPGGEGPFNAYYGDPGDVKWLSDHQIAVTSLATPVTRIELRGAATVYVPPQGHFLFDPGWLKVAGVALAGGILSGLAILFGSRLSRKRNVEVVPDDQ